MSFVARVMHLDMLLTVVFHLTELASLKPVLRSWEDSEDSSFVALSCFELQVSTGWFCLEQDVSVDVLHRSLPNQQLCASTASKFLLHLPGITSSLWISVVATP